jgi:hypothetical protein
MFATWFLNFCQKKWLNILFSYLFFTFMQNFKPKKRKKDSSWYVYLNVFNGIVTFWKNYMNFFAYNGCHNHFWRKHFHIFFCDYRLVTKSVVLDAHLKRCQKKKCQKMNVNIFTTKLGWIFHLVDKGQSPLKLLYFIMILNTISLP